MTDTERLTWALRHSMTVMYRPVGYTHSLDYYPTSRESLDVMMAEEANANQSPAITSVARPPESEPGT